MEGLDSLLSDLPAGFRKKSLADLKAQQTKPQHATAVQASSGTRAAAAGRSAALPHASAQGLGDLEAALSKSRSSPALAQQRAPSASASSSSLSNMAAAPSAGRAGAFDDLLGGLPGSASMGGASMRRAAAGPPAADAAAAPQAAAAPAPPQAAAPAAVQLPAVSGPPPAADEDPFAMFGGPPPPTSSSAAAAPVTDIDDSFLAAFAAPAPQPQQQQQRAQPAAAHAGASHDFGDFLGSDDHEAFAAPVPAAAAAAPAAAPALSTSSAHHPARPAAAAAGSGGSFSGHPPSSATAEFGYERSTSAASAGKPRYRVFDYVEPLPDSPSEAQATGPSAAAARPPSRGTGGLPSEGPLADGLRRASAGSAGGQSAGTAGPSGGGAGGGGVLHAASYQQPPAGTKDVVHDLGHKAAKALQSGTKWFMRASKTLVSQVQHRMEHGSAGAAAAAGQGGPAGRPRPDGAPGEPAAFHYDWAAQLARVSPNSRVAALGAMAEDDRLAVQRVLDESVLGDSYMEGPDYDGIATPAGQQRAQQPGAAAAAAAGRQGAGAGSVPPRTSSRPGAPSAAAGAAGPEGRRPSPSAAGLPSYGQLFGGEPSQPSARPPSPSKAPAAAKAQPVEDDLLGMGSGGSSSSRAPAAAAAPVAAAAPAAAPAVEDDLLGFGGGSSSGAAAASSSTAHIEDMFTVPSAKPRPAAAAAPRPAPAAPAPRPSGSRGAGLDSMIDLGADLPPVDTSGFEHMYEAELEAGGGDEPEERRALRLRRIQEKHARMQQQLAEKRARDEAEEAEKSGKVELRSTLKPKVDAWAAGKKDNIRALLASLHTVLWEGSGWTPPSMADMVENAKVKRVYMKANLVVHPDKVKQKGGTLEQVAIADMIFDVLKVAWGKFEASGK